MGATTPNDTIDRWLADLDAEHRRGDATAAAAMFGDECYWRDLIAFTWSIRTMEGRDAIAQRLGATLGRVKPSSWARLGEATEANGVTEAWPTFETDVARGKGQLRLIGGKAWTLLTTMTELQGHEEPHGDTRPKGTEHGVVRGRKNWAERRAEASAAMGATEQPYVAIVGGGQGGIALGTRLKRLGVPAVILEKNPRPRDSWRNRYKSLCLHDPSGTTTCRTCRSPTTGRCSRRRTRSATGSRCTRR
jgi:putative flavoprotein involved in K+ transport